VRRSKQRQALRLSAGAWKDHPELAEGGAAYTDRMRAEADERFESALMLGDRLIQQGHVLACCPVNITEVYAGLRPGEEEKTKVFMDSLEFVPVTAETAFQAGLLRRDWRRQKGHTLSYSDVTIAGVALSRNLPLLTDNRKQFPMSELELLPLP
jgi:predicted nucleic acid-binding protein